MTGEAEPIWARLERRADLARTRRIADLFAAPERAHDFACQDACQDGGLYFDYAKTNIDIDSRADLLALAQAAGLEGARTALFAGAAINRSENRAVMHWALRAKAGPRDALAEVAATRARMEAFATDLRAGHIRGAGGAITDVVNIGIGGSDLGPRMATRALSPWHDGPRCHFVSNVDGADLSDTLARLEAGRTLVIVASKTFSTLETMTNARAARAWMGAQVADPGAQFVALSSNGALAREFGIAPTRIFGFADWVGGRYSLWGPIGLSVMLAIGPGNFADFLAGGLAMDTHFRAAPLPENLPVMLALTGIWHRQVKGYPTRAVLPYEQRLTHLPAYLQQLEMESNGKSVSQTGAPLARPSGPVVWGSVGTNCQHSFMQLIHQGSDVIPCEFMVAARGHEPAMADQHRLLLANCLAQSRALMLGRDAGQTRADLARAGLSGAALKAAIGPRTFPGNRPSTTLLYPALSPHVLGRIIALYEHRVFVEGVILGLNSFDQWGVELGKSLARELLPVVEGKAPAAPLDGSTRALLDWLHGHGDTLG